MGGTTYKNKKKRLIVKYHVNNSIDRKGKIYHHDRHNISCLIAYKLVFLWDDTTETYHKHFPCMNVPFKNLEKKTLQFVCEYDKLDCLVQGFIQGLLDWVHQDTS